MFSLFGRRGSKPDSRRPRDGLPVRVPDTTLRGPTTLASIEAQRELARRTAEKIDRIESEMIDAAGQLAGAPVTNPLPTTLPMRPAQRPPTPGMATDAGAAGRQAPAARVAPAVQPAEDVAVAPSEPAAELPPLEFSTSVVLGDTIAGAGGIQVSAAALPPELEEAAILYANAQPQAAAATLRAAIGRGGLGERTRQAWLMLLDVLQASGERTEFESVAIKFAARFERSPPTWQDAAVEPAPAKAAAAPAVLRVAATLDAVSAKPFDQARRAASGGKPVTIDCGAIAAFDHDGAMLLCEFIGEFEKSGRQLVVLGADRLLASARAAIQPGRRDAGDGGWKLALAALRLLGEKEIFDELSIDYCVTYEVSPPSWEPMPANVRRDAASASGAAGNAALPQRDAGAQPQHAAGHAEGGSFALRGEIVGRMDRELPALRAFAQTRGDVVIDCRDLRRLDFVAAGELLNEVVTLIGQGRSVLFAEPTSIVEALLAVMGIHELADVRRRRH